MAEKYEEYYRITWSTSGMQTPLVTKSQMLNEIEMSLVHLNDDNELAFKITQHEMSETEFSERPEEMKGYGFAGKMQ